MNVSPDASNQTSCLLAKYCDDLLRSCCPSKSTSAQYSLSDNDVAIQLDRALSVFKFLHAKDFFKVPPVPNGLKYDLVTIFMVAWHRYRFHLCHFYSRPSIEKISVSVFYWIEAVLLSWKSWWFKSCAKVKNGRQLEWRENWKLKNVYAVMLPQFSTISISSYVRILCYF